MKHRREAATPVSFTCCGVRVDLTSLDEAVEALLARPRRHAVVHLCNAYTLSLALDDPAYAGLLNAGDLNLPDGVPLTWVARTYGIRLRQPTRGADLMRSALSAGRSKQTRHYLYGSTPRTLDLLRERITEFAPGVEIVGAEAPPFGPLSASALQAAAARMRTARADVVWVGLGTPRQDWAADAIGRGSGAVAVPVGAAFDFLAATKREAPAWIRHTGLEWVFRLGTEPRRLMRRYAVGNTKFLYGAIGDRVRAR